MNSPLEKHSRDRSGIRAAIVALGLAGLIQANKADAQTLSPEQQAEYSRFFNQGNDAFRNNDFATALRSLLQAERVYPNMQMSWNIAMADVRLAGFELVVRGIPTDRARRINDANRARLEAVLGFSTLLQIQPVRDRMQDALTRMRAMREYYQRVLRELDALSSTTNPRERADRETRRTTARSEIDQADDVLPYLETTQQSIEARFIDLQGTRQTVAAPTVQNPTVQTPIPVVPVQPRPAVQIDHTISTMSPLTYHTERPIAAGLSVAGAGLAVMGASAITFFATTPQTVGDDRMITTASNVLFWTGATATVAGAVILIAGGRQVPDRTPDNLAPRRMTFIPSVSAQPGQVTFSIGGSF